jgi:hypothetical protein
MLPFCHRRLVAAPFAQVSRLSSQSWGQKSQARKPAAKLEICKKRARTKAKMWQSACKVTKWPLFTPLEAGSQEQVSRRGPEGILHQPLAV